MKITKQKIAFSLYLTSKYSDAESCPVTLKHSFVMITISILQACCAVTTECGIPIDFCKKIDCVTLNKDFDSTT